MGRAISVRLDNDATQALRLLRSTGLSQSEAVRTALLEAAEQRLTPEAIRAEAAALAANEDDRREVAELMAFMEDLAEPLPDEEEDAG